MCVVTFAWKAHPRWRLLLAGNRDEFHARPTAALAAWPSPQILAGRDLNAGGTWMAVDPSGRACVVTNVRQGAATEHTGPSRGQLPLDFLAQAEGARVHALALQAQAPRYAPFNLLLADAEDCIYVSNRPSGVCHNVRAGVHALSNGTLDAPWPKALRLAQAMQAAVDSATDDINGLWIALSDEHIADDEALPDTGVDIELERRLSPAFIRGDTYGTRASTIIGIEHDGSGFIHERRFGPNGVFLSESKLAIRAE